MQSAFVFNTNPIIYFVYFLCFCSAAVGCLGRWWALLRQSPRQCFWATVFPFQQSISPWLLLFPLLPFRIWFSLTHTHTLSQQSLYYHFNTTADVLSTPLIYPLYKDSWWAEEKLWLFVEIYWISWNVAKKNRKRQRDYTCEYWRKQKRRNTFFYYYNYTILQKEEERCRSVRKGVNTLKGEEFEFFKLNFKWLLKWDMVIMYTENK